MSAELNLQAERAEFEAAMNLSVGRPADAPYTMIKSPSGGDTGRYALDSMESCWFGWCMARRVPSTSTAPIAELPQDGACDSALRAEPAGQLGTRNKVLTDDEMLVIADENDYAEEDPKCIVRLCRAVEAAVVARCRAEGGDGAPETSAVESNRAQQGEPVAWYADIEYDLNADKQTEVVDIRTMRRVTLGAAKPRTNNNWKPLVDMKGSEA